MRREEVDRKGGRAGRKRVGEAPGGLLCLVVFLFAEKSDVNV